MKVTSNNTELNTGKKIDKQSPGNDLDSAAIDGLMSGGSEKSDFAGVLDRVTRSHNESRNRQTERSSNDHNETRESKTREKDKVEADAYATGTQGPLTRETVASDEVNTDTRPILHSADLDSIVTACRVQLAANGHQEVTLELSRSTLDGLRVKVSADAAGRITADFLAANDGIKSLLDNRSNELIEQLRSRGINLAEFKSSVSADANSGNDSRHEQQPTHRAERIPSGTAAVASLSESESITATEDGLANGATYRA
jgi:Flagellar hook-length control protein FliK